MWKIVFFFLIILWTVLLAINSNLEFLTPSEWDAFPVINPVNVISRNVRLFTKDLDFFQATLVLTAAYVLLKIIRGGWNLFLEPLNRVRKLGDLGYVPENNYSMKEMANVVAKRREAGNIPPAYPNGWFCIEESRNLDIGQVVNVSLLGLNLALFRGEDSRVRAVDAYCPHLGASLSAGGRVLGNCIECPFHGWRFDGDTGKCNHIPYAENIPDVAKIKSYTLLERNNFIYIWYHAEDIEPNWTPPEIEGLKDELLDYDGRSEHYINCHIQEIPENGADFSHLSQVHGPIIAAGIDLRYTYNKFWQFFEHMWSGEWKALSGDEAHIGQMKLTHSLKIFGFKLSFMDLTVTVNQIGPGIVYLVLHTFLGDCYLLQHLTPMEPLKQKLIHHIYTPWYQPRILGKIYLFSEALQVERDIMIWNNKKFQAKPLYVKSFEDQLLGKHRRWYSQFYSENSPKITFRKDNLSW